MPKFRPGDSRRGAVAASPPRPLSDTERGGKHRDPGLSASSDDGPQVLSWIRGGGRSQPHPPAPSPTRRGGAGTGIRGLAPPAMTVHRYFLLFKPSTG